MIKAKSPVKTNPLEVNVVLLGGLQAAENDIEVKNGAIQISEGEKLHH